MTTTYPHLTTPRSASPAFESLASANSHTSTPTWPQSQLWDRTYDEARFTDLSKKHKDDPAWLYAELHATRRRMHAAWSDNHNLSLQLGTAANLQNLVDESNHKIIDLKRSQHTALRESSDSKAQLSRMRSRCEGLLVTNERLEQFQEQAKLTEQKWVGGLAECESYMKQLCERLEESTKARDHYKKWAIDRTDQLREAEETMSKLLQELQSAVKQRDDCHKESEQRKQQLQGMSEKLTTTIDTARKDAEAAQAAAEVQQEKLLGTKINRPFQQAWSKPTNFVGFSLAWLGHAKNFRSLACFSLA